MCNTLNSSQLIIQNYIKSLLSEQLKQPKHQKVKTPAQFLKLMVTMILMTLLDTDP
jgi:hypothetical protein